MRSGGGAAGAEPWPAEPDARPAPTPRSIVGEPPLGDGLLADASARASAEPRPTAPSSLFVGQTRETPGTPAPGQEAEAARVAGQRVSRPHLRGLRAHGAGGPGRDRRRDRGSASASVGWPSSTASARSRSGRPASSSRWRRRTGRRPSRPVATPSRSSRPGRPSGRPSASQTAASGWAHRPATGARRMERRACRRPRRARDAASGDDQAPRGYDCRA